MDIQQGEEQQQEQAQEEPRMRGINSGTHFLFCGGRIVVGAPRMGSWLAVGLAVRVGCGPAINQGHQGAAALAGTSEGHAAIGGQLLAVARACRRFV